MDLFPNNKTRMMVVVVFLYKYVYENLAQKGMKLMYDNDDDDNDVKQWLISFSS